MDSLLLFLNRRFDGRRVIVTCHGELMWAFRVRFERLTQLRYREMEAERQESERIHNGQVLTGGAHPGCSQGALTRGA